MHKKKALLQNKNGQNTEQKNGQNPTYKICAQNMKPEKVIYSIQNMTIGRRILECRTDYIGK